MDIVAVTQKGHSSIVNIEQWVIEIPNRSRTTLLVPRALVWTSLIMKHLCAYILIDWSSLVHTNLAK